MLNTIRGRMLAATLVPITLFVAVATLIFWNGRAAELDRAHIERARLLVRHLAQASEYPIFSGNVAQLQALVKSMGAELDVHAVVVCNRNGKPMAVSGTPGFSTCSTSQNAGYVRIAAEVGIDTASQPIESTVVVVKDLFEAGEVATNAGASVMGFAVVEMSRARLNALERQLAYWALWIGTAGIGLSGLLAYFMGKGVVNPIQRVAATIRRIGRGDFATKAPVDVRDPLHELQEALSMMSMRLAWGREDLQQRVMQATQELRTRKEEAESATLAKSRFLAAASHDLRQPMHALGMFIARLGQLNLDREPASLVAKLDMASVAMQDLLDGLLDLSRLEGGAVQAHLQPVELGALFASVEQSMRPLAQNKRLRLKFAPTSNWCHSDPVLLHRIVMNLVHNALRYTQQGTVLVCCRKRASGKLLHIEVWDTGIGISPEHQTEIFKEFYQVGNSGRDRTFGLGLGLNIVERSARLMGHRISVRSEPGRGTRMRVELGAAQPLSAIENALTSVQVDDGLHQYQQILVIEDDPLSRDAIRELLGTWNCQVTCTADIKGALEVLQSGSTPHVIISDFRLGNNENGLEAIAALRAYAKFDIPACILSGDTDPELMQATRDAGLALLHKPVRPAKLRSLLRRLTAQA
jgi:signal transduction histidine kinase